MPPRPSSGPGVAQASPVALPPHGGHRLRLACCVAPGGPGPPLCLRLLVYKRVGGRAEGERAVLGSGLPVDESLTWLQITFTFPMTSWRVWGLCVWGGAGLSAPSHHKVPATAVGGRVRLWEGLPPQPPEGKSRDVGSAPTQRQARPRGPQVQASCPCPRLTAPGRPRSATATQLPGSSHRTCSSAGSASPPTTLPGGGRPSSSGQSCRESSST